MKLVTQKLSSGIYVSVPSEKHSPKLQVIMESLSENTVRAYMSDLSMFCYWLTDEPFLLDHDDRIIRKEPNEIGAILLNSSISERTIAKYLEDTGFKTKIGTIKRRMASLSWVFKQLEMKDFTKASIVKDTLRGLSKLHARYIADQITSTEIASKGITAPKLKGDYYSRKPAPALRINLLLRIMSYLDSQQGKISETKILRDKALLSLWWAGAFRRSEVASLQWSYIKFSDEGLTITLPFSKTDQTGKGITKGIAYASKHLELCAVTHLKNWLKYIQSHNPKYIFTWVSYKGSLVQSGDRHLTSEALVKVMRSHLRGAGISNSDIFTGHSPRRGFVSDAYHAGAPTRAIQKQGGWKSESMLNTYIEEESVFDRNATKSVL